MAAKQAIPFSGVVPVGKVVLWYPQANLTVTPVPAIVHESFDNGTATLCLITPEGIVSKRSVYHVSNPMLKHQDSGMPTQNAFKTGGWDFREDDRPEVKTTKAAK